MRIVLLLAAAGALACGGWVFARPRAVAAPIPSSRAPVIVELFSSEGCSSCPPADAYLATLDRTQPIDGVSVIALEEHVDYWDRLGWRDPFGNPQHSARQGQYARVLTSDRVFTPEIVIDGHLVMPGGDEDAAREMMQRSAREPKAKIALSRTGARVSVDVSEVPAGEATEIWLALTESGLSTNVEAGENAGRTLVHAPVLRRLRALGAVEGTTFHAEAPLDLDPAWQKPALRVVVFAQRLKSRAIVGAAAL